MVLPVRTSSPVQMISSCMPGLSGAGQGWPVDTKITPERWQRLTPEGEPREHVAHHRREREAVAGEARGHEEPAEPGHGTDRGQLVGQESLEADPAPVERARGDGRIDFARHLEAAPDAVLEDLPAIRFVIHDASRPAAADQEGAAGELLEGDLPLEAAEDGWQRSRRGPRQEHLEWPRVEGEIHPEGREQRGCPGTRRHDGDVARLT